MTWLKPWGSLIENWEKVFIPNNHVINSCLKTRSLTRNCVIVTSQVECTHTGCILIRDISKYTIVWLQAISIAAFASISSIMDRSRKTRELFRYGMSAVYLFAFGSWFVQIPGKPHWILSILWTLHLYCTMYICYIPGLYGDNGLIPVRNTLERMKPSGSSVFERPNAMWPLMSYGFSPQTALDLVCLSGMNIGNDIERMKYRLR